jgi:hypothetical protein
MLFRRFLHIVSKISSVMKKSISYAQDELFSELKLTNLGILYEIYILGLWTHCLTGLEPFFFLTLGGSRTEPGYRSKKGNLCEKLVVLLISSCISR